MALLFSYGSNNPTQLGERLGRPISGRAAFLEGYGRVFRAWSQRWNGGVASLEEDPSRTTYGYVEKVTEDELKILDGWEKGYQRTPFQVQVARGDGWETKTAIAYVCLSKTYNKPSQQYLEAIVKTINAFWSDDHEITVDDIPLKRNPEHPHSFGHPLVYTCFGGDLRTYWDDYNQSYRTAYTPEGGIADTRAWLVGTNSEEAKRAHYELAVDLRENFQRNPNGEHRYSTDTQIQIARRKYEKEPTELNLQRLNALLRRVGLPPIEPSEPEPCEDCGGNGYVSMFWPDGSPSGDIDICETCHVPQDSDEVSIDDGLCDFCKEGKAEDDCHECDVIWCLECRNKHQCPNERNPSYRRNADTAHRKLERLINGGDTTVIGAYANSLQRIGRLPGNYNPTHLFQQIANLHPADWPAKLQRYLTLSARDQDYTRRIYTSPRHPMAYLPGDAVTVSERLQALSTIVGPGNLPGWYYVNYAPSNEYRPTTRHWEGRKIFPVNPLD